MVLALIDGVAGSRSGEEFRQAIMAATRDEQIAAAQIIARDARDRAAKTDTVLDLTMVQLCALAAIWGAVSAWDVALDPDKRLSDALKIIPPEAARLAEAAACWGGFAHLADDAERGVGEDLGG
jgi:hypothetical protein